MRSGELVDRLHRIYAAINASKEFDMAKVPAKVVRSETAVGVLQDFSGGLTPHEIANAAHSVIHNIANLHDHLKRWAASHGRKGAEVDAIFNSSMDLRIIKDLSNNDKHGYPPRDSGHSGKSPRLINVRRLMKLTAKGGSSVKMTLGRGGVPLISGNGSGVVVTSGDVVDKEGNMIGQLFDIEQRAVVAWESLLKDLGVL